MKTKEIKEMTKQERYERLKKLLAVYSDLALTDILNGYTPDESWVKQAKIAYKLLKNIDTMEGITTIGYYKYIFVRVQ